VVLSKLEKKLGDFLDGNPELNIAAANFSSTDKRRFRDFITAVSNSVVVCVVRLGQATYLVEAPEQQLEAALGLLYADCYYSRDIDPSRSLRNFPFHIDLADNLAKGLNRGRDYDDLITAQILKKKFDLGNLNQRTLRS